MQTKGTTHLTMNEFADAFAEAAPGAQIVYATGDLAYSAVWSTELQGLRRQAWRYSETGLGRLVQRRRSDLPFTGDPGGCCFEYVFVMADAPANG
jgi:hypothetical protein